MQRVPPPRGEQDGVAQLDRCDARALVVREGEDVVGTAAARPVRQVRLVRLRVRVSVRVRLRLRFRVWVRVSDS